MFEWAATILSQGSSAGAIDVVAVRDSCGVLSCSPFHVKLNKGAKRGDSNRTVKLTVNSKDVALSMKLGGAGEAFFVERTNKKIFQNQSKLLPTAYPTPFSPCEAPHNSKNVEPSVETNNSFAEVPFSTIDANKVGITEVRRRQRSFSDGDMDGDYNYLLDEQVIRSLSLCAPVSFHLEKEKKTESDGVEGTSSISLIKVKPVAEEVEKTDNVTEASKIGVEVGHEPLHCPLSVAAGSDLLKEVAPVVVSKNMPTALHQRIEGNCRAVSFQGEEEWDKFRVREICSPRRTRAFSDLSISEPRANAFQQQPRERESNQQNSPNSVNRSAVNPVKTVISSAVDLLGQNEELGQDIEMQKKMTPSIPAAYLCTTETMSHTPSTVVGEVVREVVTPPLSWSWTWGALPVKSKSKLSCSDLSQLADKDGNEHLPISISIFDPSLQLDPALTLSGNTAIQNEAHLDIEQRNFYDSHAITVLEDSDLDTSQTATAAAVAVVSNYVVHNTDEIKIIDPMDKDDSIDVAMKDDVGDIENQSDDDSLGEHISCAISIPLFVGGVSDENENDEIRPPDSTGIVSSHGIKVDDINSNCTGTPSTFKWSNSLTDKKQTAFSLYHSNMNMKDNTDTGGSQSDLLKAFVRGDPSYADMWRWDATSEAEIGEIDRNRDRGESSDGFLRSEGRDPNGSIPLTQLVERTPGQGSKEVTKDKSNSNDIMVQENSEIAKEIVLYPIESQQEGLEGEREREIDGDGDTDQELDILSLHDIPLDQISPEPAGGDFYDSDTESYLSLSLDDGESGRNEPKGTHKYRYRRVLVPSQDQLQSLGLNDGENEVSFELKTQESKGGYAAITPPLHTQLFVWPQDAKIVIIDIEGAITTATKGGKRWGMGGFLSVPRTAVHKGVVKLLTNIHKNGYRILYIAQSISTTLSTKELLAKVAVTSDIKLPPGPVFQSPDSLIRAFGPTRTDLFKAAALRGLKSLFPNGHNPFYASFGTKPCDMVAFSRCGVPEGRIFLVSPDTGEIRGVNRTFRSSYEEVNAVIHEMFPAVSDFQSRSPRSSSYLTHFSPLTSPTSAFASSTPFSLPPSVSSKDRSIKVACLSSKSAESTCSLADDDYSDFNFWKIPHVPLNI